MQALSLDDGVFTMMWSSSRQRVEAQKILYSHEHCCHNQVKGMSPWSEAFSCSQDRNDMGDWLMHSAVQSLRMQSSFSPAGRPQMQLWSSRDPFLPITIARQRRQGQQLQQGLGCMHRHLEETSHPVVVSVEAQEILVVLLLPTAGGGQAVIPCQPPLNAVLLHPETH